MARQVLPIVGAIVGAYFGNPQLGYAIGSIIGNAVDPQVINGPQLGEGQVNTAREGAYRPIVLGIGCVGCNIINVGPEIIRTKRDRQSKGGGPVVKTKRRYKTFALRISEPVAGLLRIWESEKLVYDVRPNSQIPADSAKYAEGFTFYNGSEDQLPDPDLEAYLGVGNANAYRGTSYIVFKHKDLTDTQGAIQNFRFELFTNADGPEPTVAVLLGENSIGQPAASQSLDGTSWGPGILVTTDDVLSYITSTSTRHYQWSISEARYSDNNGATWIDPGYNFSGVGGQHQAHIIGETILIPGGTGQGIYRSTDGGESVTQIFGVKANNVAIRNGFGIAYSIFDDQCSITINDGLGWTPGGVPPIYQFLEKYLSCNETCFLLGGRTANGGQPRIARTVNGNIWTGTTLSSSSGEYVVFLKPGEPGHWVALIDNGEIWFSEDDGESFAEANDNLGVFPTGLCYNGERFMASAGPSGPGTLMTSEDKNNWTPRTTPIEELTELLSCLQNPQQVLTPGKIPVSSVFTFIHTRCGHTASQYDVSEMTDEMDGVVFADGYTGADAIKTLLPIYFADASEHDAGSGYKINYVKRGKPVVKTIALPDLVDEPDEAVRQDSLERPAKLHIHFQNPTIGYAAAKATSARTSPDVLVTGEVSVQVPVTFSDVNEAWQIANKLHKISWVEVAGTQELVLAENNLDLVPTDCIGLFLRGQLIRYRMINQAYADGMLKCEFMADRQSAVTSNVTGIELPEPPPPPTSIVGPTVSAFLDIPALLDGHDALVSYAAATGQTPAWWGADYERSLDAGANYALATEFDGFNTIMGVLQADVTAASPHYTDTTNVVRVTLYTDDPIESLTLQQFLSEGGAFALSWEDSGQRHWEILQYQNAEQDSGGDWLLSTLLRGRLNTEAAEHLAGAMFVLLDNSVHVMPMQSAWLGMDLTHRAVSYGETPESATPYTDEFTGQSQTEWPVANLLLERDGDDIEATAVPRHRFGTDDAPVQSINHDGYRWTATDGVNSATADTDPPSHTLDVTGWSTPITVTVAQLNRITGAGPIVSEDIA